MDSRKSGSKLDEAEAGPGRGRGRAGAGVARKKIGEGPGSHGIINLIGTINSCFGGKGSFAEWTRTEMGKK